jgi:hypothetical protein
LAAFLSSIRHTTSIWHGAPPTYADQPKEFSLMMMAAQKQLLLPGSGASFATRSDLFVWPGVSFKSTSTERTASQFGSELPKISFVFTCCHFHFHLNHGEPI